MYGVFGEIVIAVSDENLLPEQLVSSITLRHSARPNGRQIRAGLRLGEIHRSRPFAGNHLGQIAFLLVSRAGQFECFNRAVGQHRAECKSNIRRAPHFVDCSRHDFGHALSAMLGIARQAVPAAIDKLLVGRFESSRHGDGFIFPFRAFAITRPVNWRKHTAGEFIRLFQHCFNQIRCGISIAGQFGNRFETGNFV